MDGARSARSRPVEPPGEAVEVGLLEALYESTRTLGLSGGLDEILDGVLDQAQSLIGFEHCALMLYDEERGRLAVERIRGYGDRAESILRLELDEAEGLSGWAVRHRRPVRVGNVKRDSRYVEGLAEARSNLAVPLVVQSQVVGVVNVESERPDAFTARHEMLLTVLGSQAALAIQARQTQDALRQRIDQLRALYRISCLAAEGGGLGVTLNAMLEIAQEVMPEGQCAILLLDPDAQVLRVRAGQGYMANVRYLEIPVGKGVTGRCAATGETQIVEDLRRSGAGEYIPGVPGARSEIAVPLVVEGRIIGVLNAESTEPAAFGPVHRQTLEVIARQAATVIRSAQLQEETRRLAITDSLTGLYNRRYFSQQLDENVRRAERYGEELALVLLDVDHFKTVNDRFGHQLGDRALQELARVLADSLRESDQTARIGGEEFAVLLQRANRELAATTAERIRRRIEELKIEDDAGGRIRLTASLGIALFPVSGTSPKLLMRAADRALYRAKEEGRNRIEIAREDPGGTE